ncbi:hypothetical protein LC048_07590 [Mesobacillus subterraneus]|uniref:hypothetical protein n=1 Tax=Mesobacillus subterraneus TaxID=285983 RepID=UPI001CFC5931|nr:hypothetical protein [Mesobacillus subterraneus]WLR56734.1 hypothetical protein LC048_07590 [Mesobacillus subterraneus]
MQRLGILAAMFVEDVNNEDSVVVELYGNIVNNLFKVFQLVGIPFLIYVLLEFADFF